ncbi:hypothetical protein H9L39_06072 [Fusarium oxysporum f. sp. albedinis]|nr:hypothetical protein H9L39_06072 [Fusarium oxysporum f. sp. albedinis]
MTRNLVTALLIKEEEEEEEEEEGYGRGMDKEGGRGKRKGETCRIKRPFTLPKTAPFYSGNQVPTYYAHRYWKID